MLNPKIYGTLTEGQARIVRESDIQELVNLFDICQAAREASYGVAHQPRCDETCLTMEEFAINHLDLLIDALTRELEERVPKTSIELERRNETLCQWAMRCGSFTDAAKLLVDMVSNEQNLPEHLD